jgi:hypothetical protein
MCLFLNLYEIPLVGSVEKILFFYGLVIISFLAGTHWGMHFTIKETWRDYLALLSNAIVITVWLFALLFSLKIMIITYIVFFLLLLIIDKKLLQSNVINASYFQIRCIATTIVVITLISGWFLI